VDERQKTIKRFEKMKAGNYNLNYDEFLVVIENIPLQDEDKAYLKSSVKYHYDFVDFVSQKLKTSEAAAGTIIEINTAFLLKEFIEKNEDRIHTSNDIIRSTSEIISEYAKTMGFPDYDKLSEFNFRLYEAFKNFTI